MECPADINQSVLRMYLPTLEGFANLQCDMEKSSTVWILQESMNLHGTFYKLKIHSKSILNLTKVHTICHAEWISGFFLPCQPTSYSEDVSYNQFHLRCSCVISISSSNL